MGTCQNQSSYRTWSSGQLPQGFPASHRCGGRGWESFTVRELSFLKSMQKRSDPSFFLTKTTALHHGLLLGRITPASSISFRWSRTSSNCGGGILQNRSLNGGVPVLKNDFVFGRLSVAHVLFLKEKDIVILLQEATSLFRLLCRPLL